MNSFTWLIIGHLVGDWLLQNDWMAKNKRRSLWSMGGAIHALIYTATTVGLWRLFSPKKSRDSFLGPGLVILVSHWLIDTTDLVDRWMSFFHQSRLTMVRVMVDQSLHLLILALTDLFFSRE